MEMDVPDNANGALFNEYNLFAVSRAKIHGNHVFMCVTGFRKLLYGWQVRTISTVVTPSFDQAPINEKWAKRNSLLRD